MGRPVSANRESVFRDGLFFLLSPEPEDSAGEEEESLEARVATLTASLATLAAEKSRTEAAMQVCRLFPLRIWVFTCEFQTI